MHRFISTLVSLILFTFNLSLSAQNPKQLMKAAGSPVNPKVPIAFNRYYDAEGLHSLCRKIARAYPNLVKMENIGKSSKGRDIWCMTITDFKKGDTKRKPAMYIQGNIHGNEIQGGEFSLYICWYLTESFHDTRYIQDLLRDKVFYIVPTINPDARDSFMHELNTEGTPRSTFFNMNKIDIDEDGRYNEDGLDDLNGDGEITMMRIRNPKGVYRIDSIDARRMLQLNWNDTNVVRIENGKMAAAIPDERNYDVMREGRIDNDGDGKVDEDGIMTEDAVRNNVLDPNRNWRFDWEENQTAKLDRYPNEPFTLPETKAVRDFFLKHGNISAAQSFHNCGGWFASASSKLPEQDSSFNDSEVDIKIFDEIGKKGMQVMAGYKYVRFGHGLPGREIDWMFAKRGVYAFLNEIMGDFQLYNTRSGWEPHIPPTSKDQKSKDEEANRLEDQLYAFNQDLLFNDSYVPWQEFNHPTLGKVEIGGFKKNYNYLRLTPGFLLESDAHRNMAFCLSYANEMPNLEIKSISCKPISENLNEVTVEIANNRLMPTHSGPDLKNSITPPDYVTIETSGKIQSVIMVNRQDNISSNIMKDKNGNIYGIELSNIPGHSLTALKWVIEKVSASVTVKVDSVKGGVVSLKKEINLN